MKTLLIPLIALLTAGCLSTDPSVWKSAQMAEDVKTRDIEECANKAVDETRGTYILVGPITGTISKNRIYKDCMQKKGWIKVGSEEDVK